MGKRDKRIDLYIANSAPFAQPILTHLREVVHMACADVEEMIRWGMPYFDVNGEILCNMAAFKHHCSFGFRKASLLPDPDGILEVVDKSSMGSFGRITSVDDLPSDRVLMKYVRAAAKLNKQGIKAGKKR